MLRWIMYLDTYDLEFVHRDGKLHSNEDGLSRKPSRKCKYEECPDCGDNDKKCQDCRADEALEVGAILNDSVLPCVRDMNTSNDALAWLGSRVENQMAEWQSQDQCIHQIRDEDDVKNTSPCGTCGMS